jgi:hypothetical protein
LPLRLTPLKGTAFGRVRFLSLKLNLERSSSVFQIEPSEIFVHI